jgi:hypothetical protein
MGRIRLENDRLTSKTHVPGTNTEAECGNASESYEQFVPRVGGSNSTLAFFACSSISVFVHLRYVNAIHPIVYASNFSLPCLLQFLFKIISYRLWDCTQDSASPIELPAKWWALASRFALPFALLRSAYLACIWSCCHCRSTPVAGFTPTSGFW